MPAILLRLACLSCLTILSGAVRDGVEDGGGTSGMGGEIVCQEVGSLVKTYSSPEKETSWTYKLAAGKGAAEAYGGLIHALAAAPKASSGGGWKGSALQRAMYVGQHARKLREAGIAIFLTRTKSLGGLLGSTLKVCFTADLSMNPPPKTYRDAAEISFLSPEASLPWSRELREGVVDQGLNQGHPIEAEWKEDSVYLEAAARAEAALSSHIAYDWSSVMEHKSAVEAEVAAERAAMPVDLLVLLETKTGARELYEEFVAALMAGGEGSLNIDPARASAVAKAFAARFRALGIGLFFCEYVLTQSTISITSGAENQKLRHFWFEYADLAVVGADYTSTFLYRG